MTAITIEDVIQRHRELTAEKAVILQRQVDELKPIATKIEVLEKWLLAKMNEDNVQSFKTDYGTAYQSKLTNVKLEDPIAFRDFVLTPAIDRILDTAIAMGANGVDKDRDRPAILSLIGSLGLWDLADMKPGKKGIVKYQEENQKAVPGITLGHIINVNVRGS